MNGLKYGKSLKGDGTFQWHIGGLDGKHIILQQPKNPGSHYRNYKGTGNIVLLAIVAPEYEFLFTNVGMNGRNSDCGNMSQSLLKNGFETNILNLPNPMPLPGRKNPILYVCTGGDTFHLSLCVMNPSKETHFQLSTLQNKTYIRRCLRYPGKPLNSI